MWASFEANGFYLKQVDFIGCKWILLDPSVFIACKLVLLHANRLYFVQVVLLFQSGFSVWKWVLLDESGYYWTCEGNNINSYCLDNHVDFVLFFKLLNLSLTNRFQWIYT